MTRSNKRFLVLPLLLGLAQAPGHAAEYEIDQLNKAFSQTTLTVRVGDKVRFKNSDSYFHNVYSLSSIQNFDLGSYPKGQSKTIILETPGEVIAQCAIHPRMRLAITVTE